MVDDFENLKIVKSKLGQTEYTMKVLGQNINSKYVF